MTNEEAKMFLDNLKICIDEHPVVADWLVDIADRKTEPTHDLRTETHECVKDTHDKTESTICDFCRYYNSNIPCGSTPSACKEADKFAEEFVNGLKDLRIEADRKTEPTISKMEQVDKDINVRSKDENSSEKPNNCEHITEDGVTCAKYPACDDCIDNPLNKVKGSERLVKGSEQTDCQTCKWWSSYGYCVHRECKGYEPKQTDCGWK